jgi:exo-1,4-beta-D-glucosaminidase
VPTTFLNALVQDKVYLDPYFGMNLRSVPGTQYPVGENFANFPMPCDSPFNVSPWFRGEFQVPSDYQGKNLWLGFGGINFRPNIWLNGHQIADSSHLADSYLPTNST